MIDRSSVIEALEEAIPFMQSKGYCAFALIMHDAVELLREQAVSYKPLKKKAINDEYRCLYNVYDCGYCGDRLREFDCFCSRCGKKVLWNE